MSDNIRNPLSKYCIFLSLTDCRDDKKLLNVPVLNKDQDIARTDQTSPSANKSQNQITIYLRCNLLLTQESDGKMKIIYTSHRHLCID